MSDIGSHQVQVERALDFGSKRRVNYFVDDALDNMEETWELQLRFVLITLPIFLCVSLQYDVIPNKNKAPE